jgi:hypothetical protein
MAGNVPTVLRRVSLSELPRTEQWLEMFRVSLSELPRTEQWLGMFRVFCYECPCLIYDRQNNGWECS